MEKYIENSVKTARKFTLSKDADYLYSECQQNIAISNSWIIDIINLRISELEENEKGSRILFNEQINLTDSPYADLINEISGNEADQVLLSLALCSKLYEQNLNKLIEVQERFPQIGGVVRRINNEFVPTLQTAAFLYNGNNSETYSDSYRSIANSVLFKEAIIELNIYG
jgi:hypothetical protein